MMAGPTIEKPIQASPRFGSLSFRLCSVLVLSAGVLLYAWRPCPRIIGRARTPAESARMAGFPKRMLWAWEEPQDLRFLNPHDTGVAFLASTVYQTGADVIVRPRLQPLMVPLGTVLMATARIETSRADPPPFSDAQRRRVADAIVGLSRMPGIRGVQIDFDAPASARTFYRALVADVRRELLPSTALSITALASWCAGDDWLSGLPVDEAVPMLFRMGADRPEILRALAQGEDFAEPLCRQSAGISTDEGIPVFPAGRRVYIFSPRSWSKESFEKFVREVKP